MQFIEFNGKSRTIRYNSNAVCELEDYFGFGIEKIFSTEQVGFRTARALLWAGLRSSEKNLGITVAGNYLDQYLAEGNTLTDLMTVCMKALQESGVFNFSKEEEQEEENPKKK